MKIAVGIPTSGRAATLAETLSEVERQTRRPDDVIICCASPADVPSLSGFALPITVLHAARGLPRQRNAILGAAKECDIVVFFDDDFLPREDYIAAVEKAFLEMPRAVLVTGRVIADGILGPGIAPEDGRRLLRSDSCTDNQPSFTPVFSGYGCNMAIRFAVANTNAVRFDERLPLYGWQEDSDFSRRLAMFGSVLRIETARGVHLGVKAGRTPGLRLGYSQIVNPLYIYKKLRVLRNGSYPLRHAMGQISRNLLANLLYSFSPEPFVDRRGRLKGNMLAVVDLLMRRAHPERILEL
jgi:GT2 family glycosyltransferase